MKIGNWLKCPKCDSEKVDWRYLNGTLQFICIECFNQGSKEIEKLRRLR